MSTYSDVLDLRCLVLRVPLDYGHPSARTIALHVISLHDERNVHPIGSVIVNPGGPGASGIRDLLNDVPELHGLLPHFDLVSFDPRGVGESNPIRCIDGAQEDALDAAEPNVATAAGFTQALASATRYVHDCQSKYGSTLRFFNTLDTARDMDRVRAATGDAKLNYVGFSYGTRLGAVYAGLFPTRVRAAVLDGAVDPNATTTVNQTEAQLRGFEAAFDDFAQYCRTLPQCQALGDTRAAVIALRKRLAARSLPAGGHRKLTVGLLDTGLLEGLYSRPYWPDLARGIVAAEKGNGSVLIAYADALNGRAADGSYNNSFDANNTIWCNDYPPGPTSTILQSTARRWQRQFPIFGPLLAEQLSICQRWPAQRTVAPRPTSTSPARMLVIGNLHDPATPYQGAKNLTAALGHAELLTWTGEGHTAYLDGHPCIDAYVDRYLLTTTLPLANTTCRA